MSALYFWGKPITNRLFQRDSYNRSLVVFDTEINQISCGEKHCVIIMGRSVLGFGDNSEGQLGDDIQRTEKPIIPIMINHKYKVHQVACGWNHTLILDSEGTVFSAGRGEHGELGRGKMCNFNSFQLVIKGAKQISAGKDHSLAVCGSKVMGWGNSKEGQLGLLIKKFYYYPHELNVYPTSFAFAGAKYSFFITSRGVFGTGMNQNCQLGLGHETDVQVPRRLAIEEPVTSISGGNYCAAKTANNEWYLWGTGGFGVFKYPTKMSFLNGGESVTMGLNFGLLSKNGQIWVWGSNRWGELGVEEDFKDYACEAEEISCLNLTNFASGGNFVIGFINTNQISEHSFSNPLKNSLSECNEENSSISKDLFKNFKRSSGNHSGNSSKDYEHRNTPNEVNEWNKFYEIQHDYDLVDDPKKHLFSKGPQQKQKQVFQAQSKKQSLNGGAYMTWEGGQQNVYRRRVKLTESLKALTGYHWSTLETQNNSLKQKLQDERISKQKMRQQYMNFVNMNEDNRIYTKILQLENKIHGKGTTHPQKAQTNDIKSFSSKLHSLKSLLESAL